MAGLCEKAEILAARVSEGHGLAHAISYDDIFLACTNDAEAAARLALGAERSGLKPRPMPHPSRGSEDFGRFGARSKSAMLYLGAGTDCPQVHTPTYDFPDELIAQGVRLFAETFRVCVGDNG